MTPTLSPEEVEARLRFCAKHADDSERKTLEWLAADTIADLRRQLEGACDANLAEGWKPGDLRCEGCDNGLEKTWAYCPWCSRPTWTEAYANAEATFAAASGPTADVGER